MYKYLTKNIYGTVVPVEITSKEELDTTVRKMLNEDGYAKDDFLIVKVVDYTIDATDYTDESVGSSDV